MRGMRLTVLSAWTKTLSGRELVSLILIGERKIARLEQKHLPTESDMLVDVEQG